MHRFSSIILICLSVSVLYVTVNGNHGMRELSRLEEDIQSFKRKNAELMYEIDRLERDISYARTSEFFLEKKAREELMLSRENEIVYIFPEQ